MFLALPISPIGRIGLISLIFCAKFDGNEWQRMAIARYTR